MPYCKAAGPSLSKKNPKSNNVSRLLTCNKQIWVYKNKESPGTIEIPGHEPAASHV